MAEALASHGIEFELHIYPDAPHGAALANKITSGKNEKWCNPAIADWVRAAALWAENKL